SVAEQEGQQTETEATGAPQKHHYTLNQQVGSITQKLLLICKKLFQNFMLSLDGSFACKGVMSRRGECYARHAACGNEKVLIANGEGKRQSKAFLQLR
ncbi:hypothetical protein, partial [Klebsiella pneumoniae]|uniref:hypothetical protein n=1 Tax=Klebsiella pneumoniae TaxID=573 RepID=UPI001E60AC72